MHLELAALPKMYDLTDVLVNAVQTKHTTHNYW